MSNFTRVTRCAGSSHTFGISSSGSSAHAARLLQTSAANKLRTAYCDSSSNSNIRHAMLSDSESEGEELQLTINEHFAKAYARKKEREELAKLKEKYGSDAESALEESEDSEDTDEDEDGEELTPAVDAAILRTLARIKRKDPEIYDVQKDVFEEEQLRTKSSFTFAAKEKDKSKPLLLRQHILNSTLKSTSRSPSPDPADPTHAEEQAALRKETISAFHTAVSEGSESEDEEDILIPREKTKDELEQEQEEYRAFLAQEVGEDISGLVTIEKTEDTEAEQEEEDAEASKVKAEKDSKKKKKRTKDKKSKDEADHEFLMNYILNRGWIDKSTRHVPTFQEVTSSNDKQKGKTSLKKEEDEAGRINVIGATEPVGEAEDFDEEEFDEVAETFESSYNFRFEEPDAAVIPIHPREISSTVRREDNPRKAARERKKERKEEKLLQKKEEVKRLKALKMKAIREKLVRIGKEGGKSADDEALAQLDLEGDWDPEAHDKQMAGIYGGEDDGQVDDKKPTWEDDIDIADILPPESEAGPSSSKRKKKEKKRKQNVDEDEDAGVDVDVMDADLIDEYAPSGSKSKVDRKVLDEAMDDVYGLEFNDLIGDIPTRFKYAPVLPQSYGMNAVDILLANDADLNNVVGLRTLAPYRRDHGRPWDPRRGEKLRDLHKKLTEKGRLGAGAVNGVAGGEEGEGTGSKKRKGKKERQKSKLASIVMTEEDPLATKTEGRNGQEDGRAEGEEPPVKKRKRRHKSSAKADGS